MRRVVLAALVCALTASVAVSAAAKKYGKPLTLKDTTKISDIYATPDQFNGKRVKVAGPVVDVCSERGCWIALGSDKEFQTLRFKVDDGVIVFPMDAKGLNAVVEGVVSVTTLSVEDQLAAAKAGHDAAMAAQHGAGGGGDHKAMADKHAAEQKKAVDPKSIKGPKTVIMIKGEGAEIQ